MPRAMKTLVSRAAVDEDKLEKDPAWDLTKVRSEVIDEAKTKGIKLHFTSLMDISHLKNAALEAKHQQYKGRVALRGDIVKDDSGSDADAKIMDIISRLPGCEGQAAVAVSAYLQEKWMMLTNYSKFQNRSVQTSGFVYHDTNGLNHGPVWKTPSFLLNAICMVILWQDYYGKGILRKSCCSTVGRRFAIGNAFSCTVKKEYSYLCMWMK